MLLKFKDQQESLGSRTCSLFLVFFSPFQALITLKHHLLSLVRWQISSSTPLLWTSSLFLSCLFPAQLHYMVRKNRNKKIKKCIDKFERKFSLCIASRIFEIICNLGEKEKTSHLKNKCLPLLHANTVL